MLIWHKCQVQEQGENELTDHIFRAAEERNIKKHDDELMCTSLLKCVRQE
jgi:hypothetical protein